MGDNMDLENLETYDIFRLFKFDILRLRFLNNQIKDNIEKHPEQKTVFNLLIYLKRATEKSIKIEYDKLVEDWGWDFFDSGDLKDLLTKTNEGNEEERPIQQHGTTPTTNKQDIDREEDKIWDILRD